MNPQSGPFLRGCSCATLLFFLLAWIVLAIIGTATVLQYVFNP